ncbi:MAG: molybdopterin molybdenumtransferase MoeA, partial [Bacillota bacterium]
MGIVPDDPERLRAAVEKALANDMVIISGGSSVGRDDMVADILSQLGLPGVLVHGVRMAPGKPTILALIGDRVVCGLPGNPVS